MKNYMEGGLSASPRLLKRLAAIIVVFTIVGCSNPVDENVLESSPAQINTLSVELIE